MTISFSLVMRINKYWRLQEIHRTYQQMNWKWQCATETVSASTPGSLGIVSVWAGSAGLPCFPAISISHSCQDRLVGGSDLFSQIMFLCGFVSVQTAWIASCGNSSMTAWDELQKGHSPTTCRPLLFSFAVITEFIYLPVRQQTSKNLLHFWCHSAMQMYCSLLIKLHWGLAQKADLFKEACCQFHPVKLYYCGTENIYLW